MIDFFSTFPKNIFSKRFCDNKKKFDQNFLKKLLQLFDKKSQKNVKKSKKFVFFLNIWRKFDQHLKKKTRILGFFFRLLEIFKFSNFRLSKKYFLKYFFQIFFLFFIEIMLMRSILLSSDPVTLPGTVPLLPPWFRNSENSQNPLN